MSGIDCGAQQIDHQVLPCLACIPGASDQTVKALKNNMLHSTYFLEADTFAPEPK